VRYATPYVGAEDARDVAQIALINAARAWPTADIQPAGVGAWLRRITHRAALDFIRGTDGRSDASVSANGTKNGRKALVLEPSEHFDDTDACASTWLDRHATYRQSGSRRGGQALALQPIESEQTLDVVAACESLPESQQQVLALAAEGYSGHEIAEQLGACVRTVNRELARARQTIRDFLGAGAEQDE